MLFCNCLVFSRVKVIVAWLSPSSSPAHCFVPKDQKQQLHHQVGSLEMHLDSMVLGTGNLTCCQRSLWKTQPLHAEGPGCPRVVVLPLSPETQNQTVQCPKPRSSIKVIWSQKVHSHKEERTSLQHSTSRPGLHSKEVNSSFSPNLWADNCVTLRVRTVFT